MRSCSSKGGTGIGYFIIAVLSPRGIFAPFAFCILYTKKLSDERTKYKYFGKTAFLSFMRITRTSPFVPPASVANHIFFRYGRILPMSMSPISYFIKRPSNGT